MYCSCNDTLYIVSKENASIKLEERKKAKQEKIVSRTFWLTTVLVL